MSITPINVLIAYPYVTKPSLELLGSLGPRVRWFCDSGAYTAWKMGTEITLDSYCRFLEGLPVKPWRYLTLDVIGDPLATQANYNEMRRRGFNPVPIFTRGSDLHELDAYYASGADLVGLGGVTAKDRASYAWVKAVMQHAGKRHAHILGFTHFDWLKYCKPFSADSSTWLGGARFGKSKIYMGHGKFEDVLRHEIREAEPPRAVMNRIRAFGFDPYFMQRKEAWLGNRSAMSQMSAMSWLACSIDMEQSIGTLLFLALANEVFLRNLVDAYDALARLREFA